MSNIDSPPRISTHDRFTITPMRFIPCAPLRRSRLFQQPASLSYSPELLVSDSLGARRRRFLALLARIGSELGRRVGGSGFGSDGALLAPAATAMRRWIGTRRRDGGRGRPRGTLPHRRGGCGLRFPAPAQRS